MNKFVFLGARTLLGLVFVVFGLNFFLHFMPVPPPETEAAKAYMTGLFQSGFFFPFLKVTEIIAGALLLSGFFAPLALIIIAPILINILMYHRFAAGGPPMDVFFCVLALIVAWNYRNVYKPLFVAKA